MDKLNKDSKVLVIGNATHDAYIKDDVDIVFSKDSVIFKDKDFNESLEIKCTDNIVRGGKHIAKEHFFSEIQPYISYIEFGGGGKNSVVELRKIIENEIIY